MADTRQLDHELKDINETRVHNVARSYESMKLVTIKNRATRPYKLVIRQPLFGNKMLTNEEGLQWA